ncbi:hypothetical protein A2U01_0072685, partial [Trifolium medium]|nr:hypothetical protein [Trifolium medium]
SGSAQQHLACINCKRYLGRSGRALCSNKCS